MISSPFRQSSRSAAISRACVQEVVSSILDAPAYHRGAPQAAGVDTIARAEESRGGNRAPLQTSPTPNPLAGTRTQEGPEV